MTLYDYDLVVLGDSPAARVSIELAARYRARVAWVRDLTSKASSSGSFMSAELAWFGFHAFRTMVLEQPLSRSLSPVDAAKLFASARQQAQIHQLRQSSAGFETLGVDLLDPLSPPGTQPAVAGDWIFDLRQRRLVLSRQLRPSATLAGLPSSQRMLQARSYLFAPAAKPSIPPIPGLDKIAWDTLHSWLDWPRLPRSVTIVGQDPRGIALAQLWARLGCDVTLVAQQADVAQQPYVLQQPYVVQHPHLISSSSAQPAADLLESLLQAEGVRLIRDVESLTVVSKALGGDGVQSLGSNDRTGEPVADPDESRSPIQVAADRQSWETERLVLATGWKPDWEAVQWSTPRPAIGLDETDNISVTPWGQTHHRQVYAAGAVLGRDGYGAVDRQLATAATRHILFGCRPKASSDAAPRVFWTSPPLIALGLTLEQAQAKYGADAQVCSGAIQENLHLHLSDAVVGSIQLVVHRRTGQLLGAVLMAQAAAEWSGTIVLALQQKLSVKALAQMPYLEPTAAALIQSAAEQWRWQRLSDRPRVEDLWERFFNWRRTGGI